MIKVFYRVLLFLLISQLSLFALSDSKNIAFQHEAIKGMFNGDVAENVMHDYFKNSGWSQLEGNVGRNGIDGLYVKRKNGVIADVLFVESKYNSSKLSKTKDGSKQMSKQWLSKKLDTLMVDAKKKGHTKNMKEYENILNLVKKDHYKARLWKFIPKGEGKYLIEVKKIVSNGFSNIKISALTGKSSYKINGTVIDTKNPTTPYMKKMSNSINHHVTKLTKQPFYRSRAIKQSLVKPQNVSLWSKVKTFFRSGSKVLPIIGVVAQITDDIRVENKLSFLEESAKSNGENIQTNYKNIAINHENIETNSNNIAINKELIIDLAKRVEEENRILDSKIEQNGQSIVQIYANLEQIDTQIVQMSNDIVEVKERIDKNADAIEKINSGILKTGMDELSHYYETNNSQKHLNNAYHDFEKAINIQQEELQPIVYLYYVIALTEMQSNEPQKLYLTEMEQYFQKLIALKKEGKVDFTLLLTTYAILEEYRSDKISQSFLTVYQEKIENYYADHKFEQAYALAITVSYYDDSQAFQEEVKHAQAKREENFKKHQNFASKDELFSTMKSYENELLLKEACRYLYDNAYYADLAKLLSEQSFKEQEFKLKVYLALYKKRDSKKHTQLKQLIANNSTYSKELKSYSNLH